MEYIARLIPLMPHTNLTISQPVSDDAESIIVFLNKVGGETDFLTFGLNTFPFSLEEEKKMITECRTPGSSLMLIGTIENEIVSHLFLQRSHNPRLSHIGDIGITVSKQHWGKSIGRHMMLTAIEWALHAHITRLQLQVRTDNERAIKLYKTLGFTREGLIKRSMCIDGIYFDDYIMGLIL